MKVALYARVSKADESQNPDNQLLRLIDYANERGWTIVGQYVDKASGADANRPQLRQMLSDARARRFSLVLTTKIDRIARSSLDLKQIIADLEARGIKFECTDQPFSTNTPTGKLLFGILGEIAEFERALIVERTKAGLARVKAQGKQLGRPRKRVNIERARNLRSQGLGYRKIAKELGVSYVTVRSRLSPVLRGPYDGVLHDGDELVHEHDELLHEHSEDHHDRSKKEGNNHPKDRTREQ